MKSSSYLSGTRLLPSVGSDLPQPPRPISVKLEGFISDILSGISSEPPFRIVVGEEEIIVTESTSISPLGTVLQVQDYVTVYALLQEDVFTATYIRLRTEDEFSAQKQLEFRGLVSGAPEETLKNGDDDQIWTIGSKTVKVSVRDTVVEGGELGVGSYAHVKGWLALGGRVNATHIQIIDTVAVSTTFAFEGTIQEMAPETPGMWVIGGVRGLVDEQTQILGVAEPRAKAKVSGRRVLEGGFSFDEIRILGPDDEPLYIEGQVEEKDITKDGTLIEGHIVVDGQRVEIDGNTFIDESQGRLDVGMWVRVVAREEWWGLAALRIEVERLE
jgi:hypothetical protein